MLKLATVFSGIGAIEHALERLGIDYKIEFACDNGEVDILSKDIDDNFKEINKEIEYLTKLIESTDENDDWLVNKLSLIQIRVSNIEKEVLDIDDNFSAIHKLVERMLQFTKTQKVFYEKILQYLKKEDALDIDRIYSDIKMFVKLNKDIVKLDNKINIVSLVTVSLDKAKEIIKEVT